MDRDVKRSRTSLMELRSDEDGWICSKMKKAMLHKNVEIRASWESMANG